MIEHRMLSQYSIKNFERIMVSEFWNIEGILHFREWSTFREWS